MFDIRFVICYFTMLKLKPSFLVRQVYVCCEYVLLPLVYKEADLTNSQAEQSQAGNPSRDTGML